MSTEKQVTVRDLVEEGKKRIVFLVVCVVGLSYLMSLTSSSVWVNLPCAACLIIILRYLSLDYDMKKKVAVYNSKPPPANSLFQKKPLEGPKVVDRSVWRRRVNSPVVEEAIDQFTRHLVSEWVADLWYSRITPDKEGPEELVQIINGVLGEISCRMRNINLIDFLARDLINILCTHLELFRATQAKIEKQQLGSLTIDQRETELKVILAAENKLHPALFSAAAEHKVLQHLMDGLVSLTFKPEDLQCAFFRYVVRELLACTVIRPVLNLANPRFINERIESIVISKTKADKAVIIAQEASRSKLNEPSKLSSDHFSRLLDPSVTGVELVQLKNSESKTTADKNATDNVNGMLQSRDPLLSIDARSTRSWSSLPSDPLTSSDAQHVQRQNSAGEWGEVLDLMSHRKTQALAPEHFDNMWTKGRNYKKNGVDQLIEQVPQRSSVRTSDAVDQSKVMPKQKEKAGVTKVNFPQSRKVSAGGNDRPTSENHFLHTDRSISTHSAATTYQEDDDNNNFMDLEDVESDSSTSYTTEDEEINSITGLDSPGTKVWDGRNSRNLAPRIHHPLESSEGHMARKTGNGNIYYPRLSRSQTGRKRSKLRGHKVPVWQEVERTSFRSGDGQDILTSKGGEKVEESSDDSEMEMLGRVHSGAAASSSAPSISIPGHNSLAVNPVQNLLLANSFMKLRCEVLGANIVKSGSRTFAVYSISVTDVNNNSWSIKRRFRHFEELHRRLKEFPEYNLHLPPKHFLSTGLDLPVIRERCGLLDKYLKKLLQLPTISGSIEVWDFLSVDSQTYLFSNSISIIETLSVDLDNKPSGKSSVTNHVEPVTASLPPIRGHSGAARKVPMQMTQNIVADGSRLNLESIAHSPIKKPAKTYRKAFDDSDSDSDSRVQKNSSSIKNVGKTIKEKVGEVLQQKSELLLDAASDPTLPSEWVPPNLSAPILDLVDVILQLQDGGWVRRKAFWVAKQVLQLGMGDAFDDWLVEKIQLLRKGSVIALGIRRVEQILWPDGIFITKHPKRQRPTPSSSPSQSSSSSSSSSKDQLAQMSSPRKEDIQNLQGKEKSLSLDEEQQQEANRRAKFVYKLMIDNAPAAIVSLVGRKEYEQCAKDLYFFLQSSVCLKQLVYDLLELLLLSSFPELDYAFKQLREEKQKFGELEVK